MLKNNIDSEYIIKVCKWIFKENLFIKALKDKERYGLKLNRITDEKITQFVCLAQDSFKDIKVFNKTLSLYKVFLEIFSYCFYEINGYLNPVDILAKECLNNKENSSVESVYANYLIDFYFNKNSVN